MNRQYSFKENFKITQLFKSKHKRIKGGVYSLAYIKYLRFEIAFSVSRKTGSSPVRNYEKRVAREIVSKIIKEKVLGYRVVVIISCEAPKKTFEEKSQELRKLFEELE